MFLQGFWVFFPGLKPKAKISKNIDFTKEKLIFSRVRRFKIDQKSKKNSKLEAKIRFWRPKISHDVDFGGQDGDFGGQERDFGGQKGATLFFMLTFGRGRWNGRTSLVTPRAQRVQLEHFPVSHAEHP